MPKRPLPQLDGYEFVSRIGQGAGATINLATERATGRKVAIKHVVRRSAADDKYVAQTEAEYEVAHRLDHPYLRRCFHIFRIRRWLRTRQLFLIMEYVEGDTLEHQCPDHIEDIIPVFVKVAEGLQAVHAHGYAHADMKPNNVLLCPAGGVKIIDFGQSCPLGHTKSRVQGTPDYMAPEQVLRQPIDQRTDVFNLGATMYWVVTGKAFKTLMPAGFAGTKKIELEARRGNDPPHELNPQIPLPMSRLIMDCCETPKADRPRDMREVLARLDVVQHLLDKRKGAASTAPGDRAEGAGL